MPRTDLLFRSLCGLAATLIALLLCCLCGQLLLSSLGLWRHTGLAFLASCDWNPVTDQYGALPPIVGTLLTTAIAMAIARPLAFAAALFLTDAPPALATPLGHAIDLLAAIPSVIYGMWGLFVLAPLMQRHVQPLLRGLPGCNEEGNGFGLLTAGVILAIMILPYICAIMRDVFAMTPPMLREAAYGLGCTRWEASWDIILRYGIRGLLGGAFIGLGRALGETMAVMFVIGNVMSLPKSLFSGSATIASTLANNFAEASGLQRSALFALGLLLLILCLTIQIIAQYYLNASRNRRGEQ